MGNLWKDGGERGLYKTTDGGKNWKLILKAPSPNDVRTGCGDVALDPAQPDTVYAALYARQRTPWSFAYGTIATNGADVGGIFKSTDGGATWKKCAGGLPAQTGRIGLAVTPANPKVVMAVVQSDANGASDLRDIHSKAGGVFRSEDGGEKWTRMNDIDPRPFYFSQIRLDPANDKRVYLLGMAVLASDDGGKNFREDLSEKVHPDCHALVIQNGSAPSPAPAKPNEKPEREKGAETAGLGAHDSRHRWRRLSKLRRGQRLGTSQSHPGGRILPDHARRLAAVLPRRRRIAGQRKLSLGRARCRARKVSATAIGSRSAAATDFMSRSIRPIREIYYAESQEGSVHRFNSATGERRQLQPAPPEGQQRYRFHWNAPLIRSSHQPGVLYLAANRVFRLTDQGEHSQVISPDLTKNDAERVNASGSGAENFGVIYALAESPAKAG